MVKLLGAREASIREERSNAKYSAIENQRERDVTINLFDLLTHKATNTNDVYKFQLKSHKQQREVILNDVFK
jgi:hypothetical protein